MSNHSQNDFEQQGDQWKSEGILALVIVVVLAFFVV